MATPTLKTLDMQIACAERELAMRHNAYPRWVANKRLTEAKARHEIDCMQAILDTLRATKQFCEVAGCNPGKESLL